MYRAARADDFPNFALGENGHRTGAPLANPVLKKTGKVLDLVHLVVVLPWGDSESPHGTRYYRPVQLYLTVLRMNGTGTTVVTFPALFPVSLSPIFV